MADLVWLASSLVLAVYCFECACGGHLGEASAAIASDLVIAGAYVAALFVVGSSLLGRSEAATINGAAEAAFVGESREASILDRRITFDVIGATDRAFVRADGP